MAPDSIRRWASAAWSSGSRELASTGISPQAAAADYRRGVERRDRYGRDLVHVWLEDETFFNAPLAEQGFA